MIGDDGFEISMAKSPENCDVISANESLIAISLVLGNTIFEIISNSEVSMISIINY